MAKTSTRKRNDTPLTSYEDHLTDLVSQALGEDKTTAERIISAAIQGRETLNGEDDIENWINNLYRRTKNYKHPSADRLWNL